MAGPASNLAPSRAGRLATRVAVGLGLAFSAAPLAGALVPAPAGWAPVAFSACLEQPCRFEGGGGDVYALADGIVSRTSGGRQVYARDVLERYERLVAAGISPAKNQIVLVIAREKVGRRGLAGGGFGSSIHPRDVERQHRLEVVNPKSGDEIKSVDLGPFLPSALAISQHGEQVLVAGEDLDLDSEEIRLYNTRSGKLEATLPITDPKRVVLAADGALNGSSSWVLAEAASAGAEQRFNSENPYSIAEFVVECRDRLSVAELAGKVLAVVGFSGAEAEVGQMATASLTVDLREAGFQVAERERIAAILDELYLQTSGATSPEEAARLGRLANVQYFVFGSLAAAESTSSLAVRVVSVEDATVLSACEVTCRDCKSGDYLEALRYLIAAWVEPAAR